MKPDALERRPQLAAAIKAEPYDLELWLASAGDGLFDRQVLWIARQDRPSDEQRSDLIGVDRLGNILIVELKRGIVAEDAVTQAFAYAAEYSEKSAPELAALFAAHSEKTTATGLVTRASSLEDAQKRLNTHVGEDTEVNESQVILLVGEDFTAKTLGVCDYLNRSSGEASFSIECWRYAVFASEMGRNHFLLEQVLPPPNVHQAIEEKREASKARKYARDPARVEFMRRLLAYLSTNTQVTAWRSRGQSYECRIKNNAWVKDFEVWFSVYKNRPHLYLPAELHLEGGASAHGAMERMGEDGRRELEFPDIDVQSTEFSPSFGDRLIKIVLALKVSSMD